MISYTYGTESIEFEVKRSRRKTLSIEISPPDNVLVKAPEGLVDKDILGVVKKKSNWIVQKLMEIRDIDCRSRERQFVNGESFLYLGRRYSLDITLDRGIDRAEVKLYRGRLMVTSNTKEESVIRDALIRWYKEKALEKIEDRVSYYQTYFKRKPSKVIVKEQKKRWGTCTSEGKILFNWRCVMMPSYLLDYVVVHELSHLKEMNHSKDFWEEVRRVIPDVEERKRVLKETGMRYQI